MLGTVDAYRKYKGAIFVLTKNYSNRWRAQVSYVWSKTKGTINNSSEGTYGVSSFYSSPMMSIVNSDGLMSNDRTHEVKAMVGVQIPKAEIGVNAYFRSISGGTYAPYVAVSGSSTASGYSTTGYYFASATSGRRPFVEPRGSRRLDTLNILDLRLEKIFKIGADHRVSAYADIFNALNNDTITSVFSAVGGTSVLDPTPTKPTGTTAIVQFGGPASVTAPRQIQIGARWSF